nr:extensin family protein [Aliiroseovarius subalbicans]
MPAFANAPRTSLHPVPRPGAQAAPSVTTAAAITTSRRPIRRPNVAPVATPVATPVVTLAAVARSPRPMKRPANMARARSSAAQPVRASARGSICGVRQIQGQDIARVPGKISGCGIANPVRVTSVAGVPLSQAAVMDCGTAKALNSWVERGVKPAVGRLGGGVARVNVIAHYACRTRNNKPGGKISEHGKGRAVDISGVTLKNGATLGVLKGWRDPVQGKVLKAMHAAACGPFGTVLGPNADRYHQDHLHLDTARYRSGSYCR